MHDDFFGGLLVIGIVFFGVACMATGILGMAVDLLLQGITSRF